MYRFAPCGNDLNVVESVSMIKVDVLLKPGQNRWINLHRRKLDTNMDKEYR